MVLFLDRDPITRQLVQQAVAAAERYVRQPIDAPVAVAVAVPPGWQEQQPPGTALLVLSRRPAGVEAAWAAAAGATAYLPLEDPPRRISRALEIVAAGRLHIQPEMAAALFALLELHGRPRTEDLMLALGATRRGWSWQLAAAEVGLDPAAAADALLDVVRQRATPSP